MFYVGLVRRKVKQASERKLFIRVRNESFTGAIAFNNRGARVAVRRYIKGNLSAALVCIDDGDNTPATAREKQYVGNLRHRWMIPGTGPGGFEVDFGNCKK